jgi:hypothetical protein
MAEWSIKMAKVTVGRKYVYNPVGMDVYDACTDLIKGDVVRVVNKYGCPKANTMGHCYVNRMDGSFAGLVLTNSLEVLK